jgi:hypothetical protein
MIGSPQDNGVTQANIATDVKVGLQLFRNQARRYWTRKSAVANLVSVQQDYQTAPDFVRATEVTITSNGIVYPLVEVPSEHIWNELNIIPAITIYIPTKFFVKGPDVISIWPAPSTANVGTLNISYEPRVPDYIATDVTGTAAVTPGSTIVTDSATSFYPAMAGMRFTVQDATDGNWYKIANSPTTSTLNLSNYYAGLLSGSYPYLIGLCPDIPEDYHLGLAYYAAAQYYLKRKDLNDDNNYLGMFQALLDQYRETYGNKTTGVVFTKQAAEVYSVFTIPPVNITA